MSLTTAHSLWLAPLCVLLGAFSAWLLYRGRWDRHGWSARTRWTMGVLRATAIALIAFFLLEPLVRIRTREVRKPVVVLAHDGSTSLVATGDSSAFRSGYAARLKALQEQLGERYDVRAFTYGSDVQDGLSFRQEETSTDIDQLFRSVYDRFAGSELGAVVVDGDGIYNRGRDPLLSAEKLGVPVFAVQLGDSTVRPDLRIRNVEYNQITYVGNQFPVVVQVQADLLHGRRTRVQITARGTEAAGKDILISGDAWYAEIPLMVKATAPGLQHWTVTVRPLEGEATKANNSQEIYVDVLDDRRKVLIVEKAPHPDVAAIREAMRSVEGYAVAWCTPDRLPKDAAASDLIILHQLPAPGMALQDLLRTIAARKIPTWTILGQQSDLRQMDGSGVAIKAGGGGYSDAQAVVNADFSLFTTDPGDRLAYERFPPLQVPFGQYALERSATSFMDQRIGSITTAYPLIAFQARGDRRTAITCGEGLWRWRLADMQQNGGTQHFDKLVRQTLQFLALKQDKSRFRVEPEREYAEQDHVRIRAQLYNASYEAVNDAEAVITLKDEAGRELPYTFLPTGTGYELDAGPLPAGRWTWNAAATLDGERLTAKGEFLVKPMVAERMNTVADPGLWRRMAARTNGLAVQPDGMDRIVQALAARPELKARSYAHEQYGDLIGLRWLFLPILVLLSAEWALRRMNGSH